MGRTRIFRPRRRQLVGQLRRSAAGKPDRAGDQQRARIACGRCTAGRSARQSRCGLRRAISAGQRNRLGNRKHLVRKWPIADRRYSRLRTQFLAVRYRFRCQLGNRPVGQAKAPARSRCSTGQCRAGGAARNAAAPGSGGGAQLRRLKGGPARGGSPPAAGRLCFRTSRYCISAGKRRRCLEDRSGTGAFRRRKCSKPIAPGQGESRCCQLSHCRLAGRAAGANFTRIDSSRALASGADQYRRRIEIRLA